MLFLIGINLIIFIFIYRNIRRLSNERKAEMTTKRLRALFCIVTILGLAWLSASLGDIDSTPISEIFTFLFVFFTNFQGFFMFCLYCLCKQEVRGWWLKMLYTYVCVDRVNRSQSITINTADTRNSLSSISKKMELLNSKAQSDRLTVLTRATTRESNNIICGQLVNDRELHCNDI